MAAFEFFVPQWQIVSLEPTSRRQDNTPLCLSVLLLLHGAGLCVCVFKLSAGYLEFLDSSGRYTTSLLKARYEYEQAWNPEWEANKEDALSVSVWDL